jgi:ribonuclease R
VICAIHNFTIDPKDAKDFDDALSFKKLENGNYEIGIIIDVSYY